MSVCLLNNKSRSFSTQYFIDEFIPRDKSIYSFVSPYAQDYQNPINCARPQKPFSNVNPIPFVRNEGPWKVFPKDVFHLNNPKDRAFLIRIHWLKSSTHRKAHVILSKYLGWFITLDFYFKPTTKKEILDISKVPLASNFTDPPQDKPEKILGSVKKPTFQPLPIFSKEQYCAEMPESAWAARDESHTTFIGIAHLFYLNQPAFNLFNDPILCRQIGWSPERNYQPADVVKLLIYQLLHGYGDITHLFLHLEQISIPQLKDHLGIPRSHDLPSSHHFAEDLRQIGLEPIKTFFYFIRDEAIGLKLVCNKVHGIDGQFYRTWLCHKNPRRSGLPQFYGGWYNHGGGKRGVGVYQIPLVDISPSCVIPLYPHIVPANRNENVAGWETIEGAKFHYSNTSDFFVADCGLCGTDMQDEAKARPSIPLIPIRENMKRNLYITPHKHRHFSKVYIAPLKGDMVDEIYDLRQAIERWHNFFDNVFNISRIHACGKDHIFQIIITAETITTMVAITALKIGRPDLVQTPSAFLSLIEEPCEIFPQSYFRINGKPQV